MLKVLQGNTDASKNPLVVGCFRRLLSKINYAIKHWILGHIRRLLNPSRLLKTILSRQSLPSLSLLPGASLFQLPFNYRQLHVGRKVAVFNLPRLVKDLRIIQKAIERCGSMQIK